MKTIEEAAKDILRWKYSDFDKNELHYKSELEMLLQMSKLVQRWIPTNEDEIPLNEYVNLKDDEGCILAFKFDSEVERTQLLRTNPATHWRPINLK